MVMESRQRQSKLHTLSCKYLSSSPRGFFVTCDNRKRNKKLWNEDTSSPCDNGKRNRKFWKEEEQDTHVCEMRTRIRKYNWNVKAIRRETTTVGHMRYLRHVPTIFKSNFEEGTQGTPRKKGVVAST
ncbi:hypothetical protein RJ641_014932 [Dillenia turbinata]|uniref:Uncharacterized protein n=1 Tax=Dillenia turbinata TaxID=194707 RepID=A0AAN8YZU1_9MAGN